MARQLRVHPAGGYHHVTARGNARQAIFIDDNDRSSFIRLLGDVRERFDCETHAYCLMDNHIHLLVRDVPGQLSRALRHLNGVHAQRFNRRHGRVGHVFEGRFANSLLGDDGYLANAFVYVHQNPVAAGLVADPSEYRWSSMRYYAGLDRPPHFLQMGAMLSHYGDRRSLVSASRGMVDAEMEQRLSATRRPPVLGPPEFCRRAVATAKRCPETEASARRVEHDRARRSMDEIAAAVAIEFGVEVAVLSRSAQGSRNDARSLATLLARREGWAMSEVAERFGFASGNAASTACGRFEDRLEQDATLMQRWHHLLGGSHGVGGT